MVEADIETIVLMPDIFVTKEAPEKSCLLCALMHMSVGNAMTRQLSPRLDVSLLVHFSSF